MSIGAGRAVFALFFAGAFFFLFNSSHLSAQDGPSPNDDSPPVSQNETQAIDPIIAAEQALALEEGVSGPAAALPSATSISGVLRVLLTLALAAAAIYGVVYAIKRVSRTSGVKDPFLKVLASAPLGANRNVHLVSVGSKAWLVGAAENGVHLISEIDDKDILNAIFMEDSRKSAEKSPGRFLDFKSILHKLGMPVESGAPGAENIRRRRERLKGLK